jgi:hypothetical protein
MRMRAMALATIFLGSVTGLACSSQAALSADAGGGKDGAAGATGGAGPGGGGSTEAAGTGGLGGGSGQGGSGSTSTGTSACGGGSDARVPSNHRASEGPACPSDRASEAPSAMCAPDAGMTPVGDCQQDSDCKDGINGRCLQLRPPGCYRACSYDQCFRDSDCAGNVPCHCRDSASSTDGNRCLINSNCRVDDDCGPGGYCSPSQLSGCIRMCTVPCGSGTHCYAGATEVPCACGQSCGAGYFCHTASDTCTNDCECNAVGSACTRQPNAGWACIPCAMLP